MLDSVDDAWRTIQDHVPAADPVPCPVSRADGLVLAEEIRATGDSPPFDKALMDGYAIHAADYLGGQREFPVVAEITAGMIPAGPLSAGSAMRIMTGAPLPAGCDCVVPVEASVSTGPATVRLESAKVRLEANLARRGQSIRAGMPVMPAGTRLGPAQLGALAEMGRVTVLAIPRPTVSVIATGDELVPFDQTPGDGQIRNSNELMLISQIGRAGATLSHSRIARDDREELTAAVEAGLQSDFLILSGGVSAGVLDLVPSVLAACGCERVFHGCNVKPGKPIWFGERAPVRAPDGRPRWIFGLPGNPVSSMVCFELFVRTGILLRRGIHPATPTYQTARLAVSHTSTDSRPTYFPAVISASETGPVVEPLNWQGSFDLQTVARANGFVLFESAGQRMPGQEVPVLLIDR